MNEKEKRHLKYFYMDFVSFKTKKSSFKIVGLLSN